MKAKRSNLLTLPIVLVLALPAAAAAQIYRCQTEAGTPLYQNSPNGINCKALELAPLTTIPAPPGPDADKGKGQGGQGAAARAGGGNGGASRGNDAQRRGNERASAAATTRSATPADFPRVDAATQRARDDTRRGILESELRKERDRLAVLRAEYRDGEPERLARETSVAEYNERVERLRLDLERTQSNVAAIQRELEALKD